MGAKMIGTVAKGAALAVILSIAIIDASESNSLLVRQNSSGTRPVEASTPASVQASTSSSTQPGTKVGGTTEGRDAWYGNEANVEDVLGCRWPSDFENRFQFCSNRSAVAADLIGGPQFGLLDKEMTSQLMEKCATGQCADSKMNRSLLVDRAQLWWNEMDNITHFGKCLKKNSEGMVNLCKDNDQVAQSVGGIAGLHLAVVDILTKAYNWVKHGENHTDQCLAQLSEALHFTGAFYLSSHFYSKNVVLCWDVKKGTCSSMCKQFAYVLACLKSVCPVLSHDLPQFPIWQWYFTEENACGIDVGNLQCLSDSITPVTNTPPPTLASAIASKSKVLMENVKEKYHQLEHSVESYTHLKFFQVLLIAGGCLGVFIGMVTLFCMWYHGLVFQSRVRSRRNLRYAKLIPEDYIGRSSDERKSLTRDCDDIE